MAADEKARVDDDGFPLDEQQLTALGGITTCGALIDACAEGIIAGLVSGDSDWTKVLALTAGQPNSWLVGEIEFLCADRDDLSDVIRWAREARKAMERRNQLVHAVWVTRAKGKALAGRARRSGLAFDLHSKQDFVDVLNLMLDVRDEGIVLVNALYRDRGNEQS